MLLSEEIVLPCGLKLPNRLAKSAMGEGLIEGTGSHDPNGQHLTLYKQWAEGGWGMIITGNVHVSELYSGSGMDVLTSSKPSAKSANMWKEWATASQSSGTPTIVQACHAGRQSPPGAGNRGFFAKTIAPSAVKIDLGDSLMARAVATFAFGTPREMTSKEVDEVIDQFVAAARQAHTAGFKGIQLHAAHGYLLAQFLSPESNIRTDEFGGTPAKRAEIICRILRRIRKETSDDFCIGIKLNSVDASSTGSLDEVMEQVRLIVAAGIDFLEISGGTLKDPSMAQEAPAPDEKQKSSTIKRESFFLAFAESVRSEFSSLHLMVTGGFRTRTAMEAALKSGACDLIGIARPASIIPDLPKKIILNEDVQDVDADISLKPLELTGIQKFLVKWVKVNLVGAGIQTFYYVGMLKLLGKGERAVDNSVRKWVH